MKRTFILALLLCSMCTAQVFNRADILVVRSASRGELRFDEDFYDGYIHSVVVYPFRGPAYRLGFFTDIAGLNLGIQWFSRKTYSERRGRDDDFFDNYLYLRALFLSSVETHNVSLSTGLKLSKGFEAGIASRFLFTTSRMTQGEMVIYKGFPEKIPIKGLNSVYKSRSYFYGVYGDFVLRRRYADLAYRIELYPIVKTAASALWNLRALSFRQRSNYGWAASGTLALYFHILKEIDAYLGYELLYVRSEEGSVIFAEEGGIPWEELPSYEEKYTERNFRVGLNFDMLEVWNGR